MAPQLGAALLRIHLLLQGKQEDGAGGQPHALGWAVHREGQAGLLLRLYLAAPVAVKASRARCERVLLYSCSY